MALLAEIINQEREEKLLQAQIHRQAEQRTPWNLYAGRRWAWLLIHSSLAWQQWGNAIKRRINWLYHPLTASVQRWQTGR